MKTININFPFRPSNKGYFLDLTETNQEAIKADLVHLLLTQKGERYYMPDFGTNLRKYIFSQNDNLSLSDVKHEVQTAISKYMPKLSLNEILVTPSEESEYQANVKIDYKVTDDVFSYNDFVILKL